MRAVCLVSMALHVSPSRRMEALNGLMFASAGEAFVAVPVRHARRFLKFFFCYCPGICGWYLSLILKVT